ncbi:RutC family protein [Podospora conica]|nr:RutC family protein [Schizothecium conicum]
MSQPQFFAYPKEGEVVRDLFWYSQSVRVCDRIEVSGQGGWDPLTGAMKTDPLEEIDQAFENVQLALTHAGGKGWSQVYSMRVYVVESYWDDEAFLGHLIGSLKRWMPDHQPLMTAVGVAKLGAGPSAGMRVEIEVAAHDPVGEGV